MRITGTFLDEISFDIPHQNWGVKEWRRDFCAMKAIGIKRVFLIRAAHLNQMVFPSKVISRTGVWHNPPVDLMDMFLDLAEEFDMEFFAGTWHSQKGNCVSWDEATFKREIQVNKELISEIQEKYGERKAFRGWYLTHEVCSNSPGTIELFDELGRYAKAISGDKPTLISPYFAGVKSISANDPKEWVLTLEAHIEHWAKIFSGLRGAVDIVAFQDGHVTLPELPDYLKATKKLANENGITLWSNIESFDRDMPIKFLPIKWEKFLWKMEAGDAAGIEEAITFEFSHFMSPNSMYPSAHGLFDRYCEYCGIPAASESFASHGI